MHADSTMILVLQLVQIFLYLVTVGYPSGPLAVGTELLNMYTGGWVFQSIPGSTVHDTMVL